MMTRDNYAKELIRAAEAAFCRNESPVCPHPDCEEHLSVVQQSMFSKRSLFCPMHGRIFQEQDNKLFSELDWDSAAERTTEIEDSDFDEDENDEYEDDYPL